MKYIIRINGKPVEECTSEERMKMKQAIAKSFKDYYGFIMPIIDDKFCTGEYVNRESEHVRK